ncbi:MAG: tripartite tricarboxylate transporter substrate binding protein [Betaproteobacteria bacterium]|nr:tripartite tricarboxylate transporter substrate binding protein [Betaproteobacteria bacterium]
MTPNNTLRRGLLSALLGAGTLLLSGLGSVATAQPQAAQGYPNRPVKIVVPFAASGPADIYARFIAQRLGDELKQTFVVENKPGAGSIIGTDFAAKSPADGYTLLMMSNTQTINESLTPNKPFALMRDFVAVSPINSSDLMLVVHPSVPAKSVGELIALAKTKPGKINYASSGNGTPYHMAGELFKYLAGVDMTHIPYKGSAAARTDVVGGQVDMMIDAVTTMTEFSRDGRVRGLATTGRKRSTVMPDMPTVAEAGVPKYEMSIWLGIMAPKGTPAPIVARLNEEIRKILSRPEVRDAWAKQGAFPMIMSTNEFTQFLDADIAQWATVVKVSGAKPD